MGNMYYVVYFVLKNLGLLGICTQILYVVYPSIEFPLLIRKLYPLYMTAIKVSPKSVKIFSLDFCPLL